MYNHKPDGELRRSFERLESQWAQLNKDVNRFIGKSNVTMSDDDFNETLNIANEENDVVTHCRNLVRFLTNINNDVNCDNPSKIGENTNNKACNEICDENTEEHEKELVMVKSADESGQPINNMKESAAGYNSNVVHYDDNTNDILILNNDICFSEEIDTYLDCPILNKEINYDCTNVDFVAKDSKEHKLNPVSNNGSIIDEITNETNVDLIIDKDLRNIRVKVTPSVEVVKDSTDIIIKQNKIPNKLDRKEKENSPTKIYCAFNEDDNGDSISLLDEEIFLDDEFFLNDNSPKLNLPHENEQLSKNADNDLNRHFNEKQNSDTQFDNIIGNKYDIISPNIQAKNTTAINKVQCKETLKSGLEDYPSKDSVSCEISETSVDENIAVNDISDIDQVYNDDILTWDDKTELYVQERGIPEEFDQCSLQVGIDNSYRKGSRAYNLTDERKRKNMILFKDVCYFNILRKCNRTYCNFAHVIPNILDVKNELAKFDTDLLIEEYDLIKENKIKIDYGLCFLDECIKRHLSIQVVRMATDIIKLPNNKESVEVNLHNVVLRKTLLYLNEANVEECTDLLIDIKFPRGRGLCDILLETIGVAECFSDYKLAFIELTYLIIRIRKVFNYIIASNVLKQICNIPHEASLSRALLKVLKYSHPKIFEDPMIQQFENMIKHDIELITEFMTLKRKNNNSASIAKHLSNLKTTSGSKNMPLKGVQEKSVNNERILSRSRRPRNNNIQNVIKSKETLPRSHLPVIRPQDPNYVDRKILKRKKPIKINPWINIQGAKENEAK